VALVLQEGLGVLKEHHQQQQQQAAMGQLLQLVVVSMRILSGLRYSLVGQRALMQCETTSAAAKLGAQQGLYHNQP
jgi:hypothetical protein